MVIPAEVRVAAALAWAVVWAGTSRAADGEVGRRWYLGACSRCHGTDGNGGERGPAIATRLLARDEPAEWADVAVGLVPVHLA